MKKARVVLASVILFLSVFPLMRGQVTGPPGQPAQSTRADDLAEFGPTGLWLQLNSVTDNTASLVIYVPTTATNNILDLFFTTNLEAHSPWSRVMRCQPGQTNPVMTNLPSTQGFFMVSGPIRPGFDQQSLPPNDDSSTGLIPLPFTINFLSNSESALYVNNNGNVTFDKSLGFIPPAFCRRHLRRLSPPSGQTWTPASLPRATLFRTSSNTEPTSSTATMPSAWTG